MEELRELIITFGSLEANMNGLEWALQFQRVISQLITVMQEGSINQENSTSEFQELLMETANNLRDSINRYVILAVQEEIEKLTE